MPARPFEGLDLVGLAAFLEATGVETGGDLRSELVGGGKSNLTFRVCDDRHRWVLRRPPLGRVEPGAHDVSREFRVMDALAGSAVPVPAVVAYCDDSRYVGSPFYLMDEVEGRVLRQREEVAELRPEERTQVGRALIHTLADLHDVAPAEVGLETFGRPHGYLARQLDRWQRQYRNVSTRDLREVDALIETLRGSLPESPAATVVHGDYRIDNVIVDLSGPARVAAVLDWEMATLGDPLADLATLVMFWDEPGATFNPITGGLTAFPGFPDKSEVIAEYAGRRQIALDDFEWYLCLAETKLAVILEQIHTRHVRGETVGEGFSGIDRMVDELLASAAARAGTLARRRDPA